MMAVEALRRDGELTVATFRQLVATSRKYAVPILDRCDRLGYTRRVEDRRVLGPTADELTGGTGS
jgi:selenocysteine-specific elongation factor